MAESASSSEPQRTVRYLSQQLSDRRRAKTRVNIGEAYAQWTQVKDFHGIKTHVEMANFLLDRTASDCIILHQIVLYSKCIIPESYRSPCV
uniref:Uncharacterized protein n=1 Tax=Sparus aurata TaxID=8175 RepID=A0A671UE35_SPAAU